MLYCNCILTEKLGIALGTIYLIRLRKLHTFILQISVPVMGLFDASQQCNFECQNVKGKIILQITFPTRVLHS